MASMTTPLTTQVHPVNNGVDFSAGAGGSAVFMAALLYYSFKVGGLLGAGLAYGSVVLLVAAAVGYACHRARKQ